VPRAHFTAPGERGRELADAAEKSVALWEFSAQPRDWPAGIQQSRASLTRCPGIELAQEAGMAIRIAALASVLLVVVGAIFAATAWATRRWEAQVRDVALRLSTSNAVRVPIHYLDFHFGADGLIEPSEALRDNDKLHAKLPWGGAYRHWIERGGMTIPSEAEVSWKLPSGPFACWRGAVEPVYDFAAAPASQRTISQGAKQ
jgi:hypothetical protein